MQTATIPDVQHFKDFHGNPRTVVRVLFTRGAAWMTQADLAAALDVTPQNVTQLLRGIYARGPLTAEATCATFSMTRFEGQRSVKRQLRYYNTQAISAVCERSVSTYKQALRVWLLARVEKYLLTDSP